jgi:hypothetical protein
MSKPAAETSFGLFSLIFHYNDIAKTSATFQVLLITNTASLEIMFVIAHHGRPPRFLARTSDVRYRFIQKLAISSELPHINLCDVITF